MALPDDRRRLFVDRLYTLAMHARALALESYEVTEIVAAHDVLNDPALMPDGAGARGMTGTEARGLIDLAIDIGRFYRDQPVPQRDRGADIARVLSGQLQG